MPTLLAKPYFNLVGNVTGIGKYLMQRMGEFESAKPLFSLLVVFALSSILLLLSLPRAIDCVFLPCDRASFILCPLLPYPKTLVEGEQCWVEWGREEERKGKNNFSTLELEENKAKNTYTYCDFPS